jgi:hypothetical protein
MIISFRREGKRTKIEIERKAAEVARENPCIDLEIEPHQDVDFVKHVSLERECA